MNKIGAAIAIISVIAVVGLGIWYLQSPRQSFAGPPEPIVIGIPMMLDASAPVYIADQQGYFADNGLTVTINVYDAGLYAVDDLFKGKNDIAVATEFVMVDKALKREKMCSVGSTAKYQIHYLAARRDRGISSYSDLKGKKIGYAAGTSGEFYLSRFLTLHGINLTDVTLAEVKPAQYADAIVNGSVDAVLAWDPHVDTIRDRLGAGVIVWPAQSGQLGYWNVISRGGWAAAHPELVERLMKSLDQAVNYMINHPAEAKAIVRERTQFDDVYIATIWASTQFTLSLDESQITAMDDEARWMINSNLTAEKKVPDFRDYFYTNGLASIRPGSVNVIPK